MVSRKSTKHIANNGARDGYGEIKQVHFPRRLPTEQSFPQCGRHNGILRDSTWHRAIAVEDISNTRDETGRGDQTHLR